ncbi:MAG: VOC family protein [Lachnospiraceae bacterium]|nr:VOC family protein [Lachnospiraceae bacterium]
MSLSKYIHGIQHIGIPCENIEEAIRFYQEIAFDVVYQTVNENQKVCFLQNENLIIECYEDKAVKVNGAINHFAINTTEIEKVYTEMINKKMKMVEEKINYLPFWEKGVKFFTILGPNKEQIEFCQKL